MVNLWHNVASSSSIPADDRAEHAVELVALNSEFIRDESAHSDAGEEMHQWESMPVSPVGDATASFSEAPRPPEIQVHTSYGTLPEPSSAPKLSRWPTAHKVLRSESKERIQFGLILAVMFGIIGFQQGFPAHEYKYWQKIVLHLGPSGGSRSHSCVLSPSRGVSLNCRRYL